MRYAILSDIHGNLDALEAVLEDLQDAAIDTYICLGDIVGYGPQPAECLHLLQRHRAVNIAGNHDLAVANKTSISSFNLLARTATLWTRNELSSEDLDYLGDLPLVTHVETFEIVHGTLYAPELFDYVHTSYDANLAMSRMETALCFIGHSHIPVNFFQRDLISYSFEKKIPVPHDGKVIVNVGSVGQPRDQDPRACFAVYDTEEEMVRIRRTRYDVDLVAEKIQRAGLPAALGERLKLGR